MIYIKDNIDMSLVQCPYTEDYEYIYIGDDYTNNILKLSGYSDIDQDDFYTICTNYLLLDYLSEYQIKSPKHAFYYSYYIVRGRFELGEPIIATRPDYTHSYHALLREVVL